MLPLAAVSCGKPELAGERAVGERRAFSCSQGTVFHLDDVQYKGRLLLRTPPIPNLNLSPSGNVEPCFGYSKVKKGGEECEISAGEK